MNTWSKAPIGDLCRLVNGRAFKPSDWSDSGLPIIRIQNLNDQSKPFNKYDRPVKPKYLVDTGHILLSWSGTPGTSFGCFVWDRGKAILNQHIFRVHVNTERMLEAFFVHGVNSQLDEMIRLAHGGVGLRHITKGKLEGIELPVPPLDEQRRIVARINECIERIDEVRALRGQTMTEAAALLGSILNDLDASRSWPRVALGDILVETRNGRSIRATGDGGNGRVLTLSAVRSIDVDLGSAKTVFFDDALAKKYQVSRGDLYVSRSNTKELVGLASIVSNDVGPRTIFPDLLIRLRPDESRVRPRFLAFALRFPSTREQIRARATGTSQSMVKISGARLREVVVPVPPVAEQDEVLALLDDALSVASGLVRECLAPQIAGLPGAILRRAFAGEL